MASCNLAHANLTIHKTRLEHELEYGRYKKTSVKVEPVEDAVHPVPLEGDVKVEPKETFQPNEVQDAVQPEPKETSQLNVAE